LDAIGRARQSGGVFGGANDEREQTLNQILTEMDGFETSDAVIVLAATNRPEVLDPALLRPGRFDRRVAVPPPDREGRLRILQVHSRDVPLGDDVDLTALAASTPGTVGADLANLINEAALLATRREHEQVRQGDFTDALEKILLGAPRGIVLSPQDKERTAYHEAGHALVGMLTPGADPVRKISIIPRGGALGVTLSAPDDDRVSYTRDELLARMKVSLGGRGAEALVYESVTTGAESDLEQLTRIARMMVGRWGMSEEIGLVTVLPSDAQSPYAAEAPAQGTQQRLDDAVRALIDGANGEVAALLREHRARLDSLTAALLENETLDADGAYAAAGVSRGAFAPGGGVV
jgi:cell division protease FtsH